MLDVLGVVLAFLEELDKGILSMLSSISTHTIYSLASVDVVLVVILGGTLFCGWKCNLFCRPCCKSQYLCYGSAIVVVLVILILLVLTASLVRYGFVDYYSGDDSNGKKEIWIIHYLSKTLLPITHCYVMTVLWNTLLKLPYTVPEVLALVASAIAVASILTLAVPGSSQYYGGLSNTTAYPLLAVHLVALGITWYCLEYKRIFYWPKEYLCLGVLVIVLLVALVQVAIAYSPKLNKEVAVHKYILLGYSVVLMVPTLWYAYRCGLFNWCVPKKKGINGNDSAENTAAEIDIAKES